MRSRSVPQRLGFVEEGILRNTLRRTNGELTATHRYGMTKSEFHASEACAEWRMHPLGVAAFDALGRRVTIAETLSEESTSLPENR